MSVRDQQIEDELKNISVTKDAYELWLQNDVTRMFMLQMEEKLESYKSQTMVIGTIEEIAIVEIARSVSCNVYDNVINWQPDF